MRIFYSLIGLLCGLQANSQAISLSESFNSVSSNTATPVPGWTAVNLSEPIGVNSWFRGSSNTFSGYSAGYIGANYHNTKLSGTISNWLISPELQLVNGRQISFWTRIPAGDVTPDRLEVRLSSNGNSTDVGSSSTSVGDFTTVLTTINPSLTINGYPQVWTLYTITLSGLPAGATGRIAFRYYVTDGGEDGINSNYIGIDEFSYGITLPISLASFNGEKAGNRNLLTWATVMERNNAAFTVERSIDGVAFSPIATVASKAENGNSNDQINYEYIDNSAPASISYYRLKQLDKDGKYYHSPIIFIKGMPAYKLKIAAIYPNPVQNELKLIVAARSSGRMLLLITDLNGRIITQETRQGNAGDNVCIFNVSHLTSGAYIIKVIDENKEIAESKFVKD